MSQQVRFAPEASAELEDATRWYEQRHAGLGLAFSPPLMSPSGPSPERPELERRSADFQRTSTVRRVPVSRFPYHLVYLVTEGKIDVLGGRSRSAPTRLLERSSRPVIQSPAHSPEKISKLLGRGGRCHRSPSPLIEQLHQIPLRLVSRANASSVGIEVGRAPRIRQQDAHVVHQ